MPEIKNTVTLSTGREVVYRKIRKGRNKPEELAIDFKPLSGALVTQEERLEAAQLVNDRLHPKKSEEAVDD